MKRNITISYILSFAKNSWFWLGIWVFYYLKFTDYSGIGIIETVMIATTTLFEIPTGAIADLIGRKRTLIFSFLFEAVGGFMMAFAADFNMIVFSVFVMCVGGALYSGTLEALVYDSLKAVGDEELYEKTISNINSLGLFVPAVCGVLGGFFYSVSPHAPFFLSAIGYSIGFFASLFLVEPKIDSLKFSFINFINQSKQGLKILFVNNKFISQVILILSIGSIMVIADEMLDGFLGVEFGFDPKQLGILLAVMYVISSLGSQLSKYVYRKFSTKTSFVFMGVLTVLTFIVSPISGKLLGSVSLVVRSLMFGVFVSLSSTVINGLTESKYRATTISTFNVIKNIPYVLFAYFVGVASNYFSAKMTALYLGVLLLILILYQLLIKVKFSTKTKL